MDDIVCNTAVYKCKKEEHGIYTSASKYHCEYIALIAYILDVILQVIICFCSANDAEHVFDWFS